MIYRSLFVLLFSATAFALSPAEQGLLDKEIVNGKVKGAGDWQRVQRIEQGLNEISPPISRLGEKIRPITERPDAFNGDWMNKAENRETFKTPWEGKKWKKKAAQKLHEVCCRAKADQNFFNSLLKDKESRAKSKSND